MLRLRHVHLFGKPTSAIRDRTAVRAWVELDRVSDLGVDGDRPGSVSTGLDRLQSRR